MNIIILGAGQVGGTLAESLVRENHDITLIDRDPQLLRELQMRLDIRTICGHASHPHILRQAGCENADMIIAVTNSDETNMVGCQIASTLFHTPKKIARIRADSYLSFPDLFQRQAIPIDVRISPEQLVTDYVQRLINFPGALQVLDFSSGCAQLVALRPQYGGPLAKKTVADIYSYMPTINFYIAAVFRRNQFIDFNDKTLIEVGDEVFFLADPNFIKDMLRALGRLDNPYKRIMIAGGGNIGLRLAHSLEKNYRVKIIDHNLKRTQYISQELNKATVLHGDASDRELLINENVEEFDVFCAVTNDDEANIMSCLQAKRLGVRQVMALITRTTYAELVEGRLIDVTISPQQTTIGSILTHMRKGDISNVHSLRHGAAEAIEITVHGDESTSKIVGRYLSTISLPPCTTVGAIVRGEEVLIAREDIQIQSGDHVILFITNKKSVELVEQLFQVNIGYFS